MPGTFLPLQQSFSAGQISKRMAARSDSEGYHQSIKEGQNFVVYPQGPADMRTGFEHIDRLAGASTYGRIVGFEYSQEEAYVVVVTKDEIRVINIDDFSADSLASPYSTDDDVRYIQKGDPPGEDRVVLVSPTVAPQYVDYGSPFTTGAITFTSPPAEWTGSVWPQVVGFAEGRAWYANISGHSNRYWASKSGSFYDITTGSLADDAIDRIIDRRGAIRWIVRAKKLTFGTENGVYIVTSEAGVITPSDIQVDRESSKGSGVAQGFDVSNSIVYPSPDGRKIYEFKYDFDISGWASKNLAFVSEDITESSPIVNVAYDENPESILWCSQADGSFLGLTRDFSTDIQGWHAHSAERDIVDVCSVKLNGTSQLWALMTDGTNLDVVRLGSEYMDNYSTQSSGASTHTVGPFAQLAGEEVQVTVDGANDGTITLDGSGNGTTTTAGTEFVVGLALPRPYIMSLNMDKKDPLGSASSLMKRWPRLFVHISESAVPIINGQRPATRSPGTDMGSVEDLRTEKVQVPTRGYDREGTVTIEQDIPFKTTILAFLGQMRQN